MKRLKFSHLVEKKENVLSITHAKLLVNRYIVAYIDEEKEELVVKHFERIDGKIPNYPKEYTTHFEVDNLRFQI